MATLAGFLLGSVGFTSAAATGTFAAGLTAGAAFAGTTFGALTVKLLSTVATSALLTAMGPKPEGGGGISIPTTLHGEDKPETILFGLTATAGQGIYVNSHGPSNRYITYVIELCSAPGAQLNRLIFDDDYVDIGTVEHPDYGRPILGEPYEGRAWIRYYDGRQTAADPMLVAKYGTDPDLPWSSTAVGAGICYAILTFMYHARKFAQIPRWLFEMKGVPVYDPRKDSSVGGSGSQRWANPLTWAWSDNPAVIGYNIKRGYPLPGGDVWGGRIASADLRLPVWMPAMTKCDAAVPLASGGTEPRYRCGIEVAVTAEPATGLAEIYKAASAEVADVGGSWTIRVGEPGLPVLWISDRDIVVTRTQEYDPFPVVADTYNGVSAQYPDPDHFWAPRDAPKQFNPEWEDADAFGRRVADLSLPAVPYRRQVQRLMRSWIRAERRFRRHVFTLPGNAAAAEPLEVIDWTSLRNGYLGKDFELAEIVDDVRTGVQQVSLLEVDPSDYDWEPGFELPSVPGPRRRVPILPVDGFSVQAITLAATDGRPRSVALRVVWSPDITADAVQWQVRKAGHANAEVTGSKDDVEDGFATVTNGILPATAYEARARLVRRGNTPWTPWVGAVTADLRLRVEDLDDASGPAVPQGLALSSALNGERVVLSAAWNAVAGSGIRYDVRIREGAGNDVPFVTAGTLYTWDVRPATSYTVAVRAVNRIGLTSAWSSEVTHVAARDTIPPAVPVGLSALAGFGTIWLKWAANGESDLSKYEIYESDTATPAPSAATVATYDTAANTFVLTGLDNSITKNFWVRAVDTSGNASAWTARVSATTAPLVDADISDIIESASVAANLSPPVVGATLPTTGNFEGRTALLTTTGQLYTWRSGAWQPLSVTRDLVNPVSTTGTLARWGGVGEDGAGGDPAFTFDAVERAMAITTDGNLAVRSDTFPVDHGKIYRVSFSFRKNVAGGSHFIGLSGYTAPTQGLVTSGSAAGPEDFTGYVAARTAAAPTNKFYFLASSTLSDQWEDHVYYIIGNYRDVMDCPAHVGNGARPFVKLPATCQHLALRVLNYYNAGVERVMQVKDVSITEVTAGQIVAANLVDGAVTDVKFAVGLRPVEIVSALPTTGNFAGRVVFLETDGKIYRHDGTSFVASVPAADIDGQVQAAQIAAIEASKVTGQLTNAQIADLSAAKLAGQITQTQITDGAISTGKLAAAAVAADKIATSAITADKVAANAITAAKISTGAVEAAKIAAGAVQADKIAAGAVLADKLAANAVTAGKIAAGAVTADTIAAEAVTAGKLDAGAVTAGTVAAGAIGATEIAAGAVVASKIAVSDFANLITDHTITDADYWSLSGIWQVRTNPANTVFDTPGSLRYLHEPGATGWGLGCESGRFPVEAGREYQVRYQTYSGSGLDRRVVGRMVWYDAVGALLAAPNNVTTVHNATRPGGVSTESATVTAPPSAKFALLQFFVSRTETEGDVLVGGITVRARAGGELIVDGALKARHMSANEIVIDKQAQIANAVITDAHITELSAGKLVAGSALAGSITVDGSALTTVKNNAATGAQDPAQRINAGSTKIDPGKIVISGATTLADWRKGGDLTRIDGGALSANTVSANKLTIGNRMLTLTGIEFEHNAPTENSVSWTAGTVRYINDAGSSVATNVTAGSAAWSTGVLYIYWTQGATALSVTTSQATALAAANVVLATYQGGRLLDADYGRTIIDGAGIKTGTVTAAQINAVNFNAAGLAVFNGALKSDDYVAGSTGWWIMANGNAEFNNLVLRGWLQVGSVSDRATAVAGAGTPNPNQSAWDVLSTVTLTGLDNNSIYLYTGKWEQRTQGSFQTRIRVERDLQAAGVWQG